MSMENKRELARQLMSSAVGLNQKSNTVLSQITSTDTNTVKHQGRGFDNHPGALEMIRLKNLSDQMGLKTNPYFQPWSSRNGAKLLMGGNWKINYSAYNYLGMAEDLDLAQAAKDAIDKYGTSVSAARIVSGQIPLYEELENEFAEFFGTEDALIFVSGFLTNVSTLGYLLTDKDLIIHDELIHNSMVTGALLSGARRLMFPHNSAEGLDRLLKIHRHLYERAIVLTEGVFSMDGDVGNIQALIDVAHKHDASIMVDEAHSLGTIGATGRGVQEAMNIKPNDVDIWMGSLSKSLGSVGGYVAGSRTLINNLRYYAPGAALYCATTPPASAAAALCALRKLKTETWRVQKLQNNAAYFLKLAKEKGLNTGISQDTAVVPIIIGETEKAVKLAVMLNEKNINVQAIFYPVVPMHQARLRFFLNSTHTTEEIEFTVSTIAESINRL